MRSYIMSKILSKTKSIGLNFALLFCICLSLLPLSVTAQTIDFSGKEIKEPINIEFWKRHLQKGIEIDSSYKYLARIIFHHPINFSETDFLEMADFSWVIFDSSVNFSGARFFSTASFRWTWFHGWAVFRDTRFEMDVQFTYTILPDTLDFMGVKDFSGQIDFTLSEPPLSAGKCHIALAGADISKIKLDMHLFTLWFPKDTTSETFFSGEDTIAMFMRIRSPSYDIQLSGYESVLKKLKDDGLMESYQILDIDYHRFKYEHGGFFDWHILDTVLRWWWNYGYSKERVFVWAIGLWVLFSLVNLRIYPKLSESVYAIPFLEKLETSVLAGVKKRLFYFFQVVTYTAIVFFGLKMDVAKFKKGVVREHPGLFAYLMVVYVAGLVCLGFIVNIIFTR